MARTYEELIHDVLVKHGVALGNEDPILVLHTINRKLAEDLGESVDRSMNTLKEELEQLYFRWDLESKAKAERILAAAVAAAKNHLQDQCADLTAEATRSIGAETKRSVLRLAQSARRLEWLVVAVGAI